MEYVKGLNVGVIEWDYGEEWMVEMGEGEVKVGVEEED